MTKFFEKGGACGQQQVIRFWWSSHADPEILKRNFYRCGVESVLKKLPTTQEVDDNQTIRL